MEYDIIVIGEDPFWLGFYANSKSIHENFPDYIQKLDIGLKVDSYIISKRYLIVDKRKWFLAKIKYGIDSDREWHSMY